MDYIENCTLQQDENKNVLQETQDIMKNKKNLPWKYSLNHLHCYKLPIAKLTNHWMCNLVTHSQMTITIHHYGRNTTIHTLIRQQLHGIVRIHNTKIKFNQEEVLKWHNKNIKIANTIIKRSFSFNNLWTTLFFG